MKTASSSVLPLHPLGVLKKNSLFLPLTSVQTTCIHPRVWTSATISSSTLQWGSFTNNRIKCKASDLRLERFVLSLLKSQRGDWMMLDPLLKFPESIFHFCLFSQIFCVLASYWTQMRGIFVWLDAFSGDVSLRQKTSKLLPGLLPKCRWRSKPRK